MKKLPIIDNAGTFQVLVPNHIGGDDIEMIVLDENQITDITSLSPVNGNGQFQDFTTINFEDAYIIVYWR